MVAIAPFLKAKRKEKKLSMDAVLEKLKKHGITISPKTVYGWESGARQPDADTFIILCAIYGVKSFSEINGDEEDDTVSSNELKHIEKYRGLDDHGKDLVDTILEKEHIRSTAEADKVDAQADTRPRGGASAKIYETTDDREEIA